MRISDWSSDVCSSDLVSDGDSTSWPVRRFRENAKRKILKREVCSMVVGACNPATPAGDMRVIDSHIILPNMQRAGRSATEQQTSASAHSEKSVSQFSRSIEANGAGIGRASCRERVCKY